jgi:hypothetical protein
MDAMTPADRILKIGKKLERNGLKAFGNTTPGGQPAYFRAHGLQIIPSEAEELDTGKACRLVITLLAANLSGLVFDVIAVIRRQSAGQRRAEALIEELKAKAFQDIAKSDQWESAVAKNIISVSLKLTEHKFEDSPVDDADNWSRLDPLTGDINEYQRHYWSHAQEILRRNAGSERSRMTQPFEARYSMSSPPVAALPAWVEILGHVGVVISGFWIPVVSPVGLAGPRKQADLVRVLRRKNLKPDVALTIIANAPKRAKRTGR